MNFDQANQVGEAILDKCKYLQNIFLCKGMEDYLNKISSLKSFSWLKEHHEVLKSYLVYDDDAFLERFKTKCIAFYPPAKVEDGVLKIIYQISPTLHIEASVFVWYEANTVYSQLFFISIFKDLKEYIKFMESISDIKKHGQTGENSSMGFSIRK